MKRTPLLRKTFKRSAVRWLVLVLTVLIYITLFTGVADARIGGGGSFSGGGSGSSGSSGGGGGGEIQGIFFLIQLIIEFPAIGIPVTIIVIGFYCVKFSSVEYSSAHPESILDRPSFSRRSDQTPAVRKKRKKADAHQAVQSRLDQIRRYDPNFSEILFMDFAYAIYARVQETRGKGELGKYSPYLSKSIIQKLQRVKTESDKLQNVLGVIVGGAQIIQISSPDSKTTTIRVRFETNYTEVRDGKENTFYCEEIWNFTRLTEVLSPPPERIRVLGCPNCGSPLERKSDGTCANCGVMMAAGKYHWMVNGISILRRETRGPLLTSDVPEVGTNLPTVLQPNYATAREQFMAAHPKLSWRQTEARFRHIFIELQHAWTSLKWERARPFETDQLFQFHRFWIQEYEKQQLRNVLDDIHIEKLRPVKMQSDAFFNGITVRIWANMKDYTVDPEGNVVCGNKHQPRRFTEYWTFIRRRGVKESNKKDDNCPNCGAPLKINMSGICEYCDSKITSGEFDWVLSRIEQDEAYMG